jgi:hypothetical protein
MLDIFAVTIAMVDAPRNAHHITQGDADMPTREENQETLSQMCEDFLADVEAERGALPERTKQVFRGLLNDPNGAHENLLEAIDQGNLQVMMNPVGGGQGMYTEPSKMLGINPDAVVEAGNNPAAAYNLNFTIAHECRHARDGAEIANMRDSFAQAVLAKSQEEGLPHDYTQIVNNYLQRDRVLEERAETAGLNAHVSKVIADRGGQATLRDIYQSSPRDMAPYIDITPGQGMFGRDQYAYKPGLATAADGLHLDANSAATLNAMGQYFYDAQNYDWKQGLKATLDIINLAEKSDEAVKDPRSPPQIDFNALGVGPPPDAMCRASLQGVGDANAPRPNAMNSPDRPYFELLQGRLPDANEDVIAYTLLKAKEGHLNDPAQVVPDQVGVAENGHIWIGGTRGERIEVDPAQAPPIARTTQDLNLHALERAEQQAQAQAQAHEQPQQQKGNCAVM